MSRRGLCCAVGRARGVGHQRIHVARQLRELLDRCRKSGRRLVALVDLSGDLRVLLLRLRELRFHVPDADRAALPLLLGLVVVVVLGRDGLPKGGDLGGPSSKRSRRSPASLIQQVVYDDNLNSHDGAFLVYKYNWDALVAVLHMLVSDHQHMTQ